MASDIPPNLDLDEGNDTDTPEDVPAEEEDSNNNQGDSPKTTNTQAISKKTRSACGDEPPPKRAKLTGGHVLAESIVAVVEEMRASRKDSRKKLKHGENKRR